MMDTPDLRTELNLDQFEVLDIVPIPMKGDRMVRLRTLEEAIDDFTLSDDEVHGYFIQLKARKAEAPKAAAVAAPVIENVGPAPAANSIGSAEGIYLPDGKLNLPQLMRSAELLFSTGDYPLARNIYKAIIRAGEGTAAAIFGIARCFEAEGKLEEARINYEESIAYHPNPQAYKNLSSLLIRLKKDQEAAETLDRALLLKELSPETRFEFHKTAGNCWNRVKNAKEAERHYRKALEIRPNADDIHVNMGSLYMLSGRQQDARFYFQQAVLVNPASHAGHEGLGLCALDTGDKQAAHDHFASALKIEVKNPTAIFHLVKCAYSLKKYATAAEILESYVQVAPVNANLLYSLAGLQFHLGRLSDSFATCARILKIAPGHSGATELSNRIAGQDQGMILSQ